MTPRESFINALERKPSAGLVPHFELEFFLTMEALVDVGDDAPLIHRHGDLIDDLVRTHTTPLRRA